MEEGVISYLGIRQWYIPNDLSTINADVIAVHGLAADPYNTWIGNKKSKAVKQGEQLDIEIKESRSGREPWLQTLLPIYLPRCRILTFGYQCNYFKNGPKRNIANCALELLQAIKRDRTDEARKIRPIIFVGHSFGGIVIKEALVKATLAREYFGPIKLATRGVVFLGTPHSGITAASYVDILLTMLKACGHSADRQLVHSLRKSSSDLLRLNALFDDIRHDFRIHCFYELLPWKFSVVAVDETTATIPGVPKQGLMKTHSGLNKYSDADDPDLRKVGEVLKSMTEDLSQFRTIIPASMATGEPILAAAYKLVTAVIQGLELSSAQSSTLQEKAFLDMQRRWFQVWAYMLGLAEIDGTPRSLHTALDLPAMNGINQSLTGLSSVLNNTTPTSRLDSLRDDIDAVFRDLRVQTDPESSSTTRHIFVVNSLADAEQQSLLEVEGNSQTTPDIPTLSAMTRLDDLIKKSLEGGSTKSNYIDFDLRVKLDKSKSSSRSTGNLFEKKVGDESPREILIEWKRYDGTWDVEIGNVLFNRVDLLTDFLCLASRGSEAEIFRILECLGYCHDRRKNRLGFVFSIPPSVSQRSSYIRLNTLIRAYNAQQLLPPSVSDRIELARSLCSAMFACHATNWFHKTFSSHNILIFADVDDTSVDGEDSSAIEELQSYSILSPFVTGFVSSRPTGEAEFSEVVLLSDEERRYRHPSYGTAVGQKFLHEFDYYSLGIVLLEIGQWRPLSAIMQGRIPLDKCSMEDFASSIRNRKCRQLSSYVGDEFEHVVHELLNAFSDERPRLEQNRHIDLGELLRFQTDVLEALEMRKI